MKQVLARSARPRTLSAMVGQEKAVKRIRKIYENGRLPNCWMFYGSTGAGKTTMARILAVALQCSHQKVFGDPCKECYKNRKEFPIHEINASDIRKIEDIEQLVRLADYKLLAEKQKHVFIFDEAHGLTKASQNLLLKYFEDSASDVYWMLCTTEPNGIKDTLRRRCGAGTFKLRPLMHDDVKKLVSRLLEKVGSDLSSDTLTDVLMDREIRSPGLIADAVDNYVAGASAEEAVDEAQVSGLDTKRLCRAVVNGDWRSTADFIRRAQNSDARAIRASVVGYLRTMLLDSAAFDSRSRTIAKAIKQLGYLSFAEDLVQITVLAAELNTICEMFAK